MAKVAYCEDVWRTKERDGVEVERWQEPLGVFDPDEARLFVGIPQEFGRDKIFQAMHLTADGLWIRYTPGDWRRFDCYNLVAPEVAREWLCANGHEAVVAELFG